MLRTIVQNILVYVVMTTILKGLISNKSFLEIFRFASGIILILLFISPVISALSLDGGWYEKLEENLFQVDKKQIEEELKVAEGSFETILMGECEEQVKQQIQQMAEKSGQKAKDVEVMFEQQENGELSICQVQITVENEAQAAMTQNKSIVIEIEQSDSGKDQEVREDQDTRHLKKKICKKYDLTEEMVAVWKIYGENYSKR